MTPREIITALLPVPVFYFIYFRHFLSYFKTINYRPAFPEQAFSFLSGAGLGLVLVSLKVVIDELLPSNDIAFNSFIKAAVFEKTGAAFFILIIHWKYRSFNLLEAIVCGILVGAGFSFVENILYAASYGYSIILARSIISVPLHLVTCGILGYYLGLMKYSGHVFYKIHYILRGLIISISIHGIYDFLLITGKTNSYLVGPILIASAIGLEIILAQTKTVPFFDDLKKIGLGFEDWMLVYRQPRYERWISRSMESQGSTIIPVFKWNFGLLQSGLIILSAVVAAVALPYRNEISGYFNILITTDEKILITGVLPLSITMLAALVGSINPEYIKNSIIKIPVMYDAMLYKDNLYEETLVTFDINITGCFLRTYEPLGISREFFINLGTKETISPASTCVTAWENHTEKDLPTGTIVNFKKPPFRFMVFIVKYYLSRVSKGLFFNLKLPGFDNIKKYFIRPFIITQKVREYPKGAVIFNEDDYGREFYLIKKGSVDIQKKKESGEVIILTTLGPGEILGEMAILGNNKRNATAVCSRNSMLVVAGIDELKTLIQYNPDFAYALLKKLAGRTNESQKILIENIEFLENIISYYKKYSYSSIILLLLSIGFGIKNGTIDLALNYIKAADASGVDNERVKNILDWFVSTHQLQTEKFPEGLEEISESLSKIKLTINR